MTIHTFTAYGGGDVAVSDQNYHIVIDNTANTLIKGPGFNANVTEAYATVVAALGAVEFDQYGAGGNVGINPATVTRVASGPNGPIVYVGIGTNGANVTIEGQTLADVVTALNA